MAFEVFHFPYNRADHPSSWDLAFSIHEDMDVIQALCLNHLVSPKISTNDISFIL